MSSKEQLAAKIKAAAWQAASEIGANEAVRLLQQVAQEIQQSQWSAPGDR